MSSLLEVDTKAFEAALPAAFQELQLTSAVELIGLAHQIEAFAKQYCPYKTGNLRRSITTSRARITSVVIEVDVGTDVTYASYVEFGTSRMDPQPFMRPAMAQAIAQFGATVSAIDTIAGQGGRHVPGQVSRGQRGSTRRLGPA